MNPYLIAALIANAVTIVILVIGMQRVRRLDAERNESMRDMYRTLDAANLQLDATTSAADAQWRARHIAESDARIAAKERQS